MHDSALDFLVMVIVLGIVVALGFNTVTPIINKSKQLVHQESFDKTVNKLEGDRAALEYDGCVTADEIVLATMGQTYFMPKPGYLEINGEVIIVSNNVAFSPNSIGIGTQTHTAINQWFNQFSSSSAKSQMQDPPSYIADARFKIMFAMNEADSKEDDSYSAYILLTRISTGKAELFKCENGGGLIDRSGNKL